MTEGWVQIGEACMADAEAKVINFLGHNYHAECGMVVASIENGELTSCVKPVDHSSKLHEDIDGRTVGVDMGHPNVLRIPIPRVFSTDEVVTKADIQNVWRIFVEPSRIAAQAADEDLSDEVLKLMGVLRGVANALPEETPDVEG